MKGIVYCHINKINGKRYIGETTRTLKQRVNCGKKYSRRYKFGKAIDKYGWDNFETVILETIECDDIKELEQKLFERETYWITYYNSCKDGYNTTPGGCSSYLWSDDMKDRASKRLKGHKVSKETCLKISQSKKGKKRPPVSEETRLKLSQASRRRKNFGSRKGQHNTEEQNKKIADKNRGRKLSQETIRQRTETRRLHNKDGSYNSPETTEKLKSRLRGKKLSKESIIKRTETRKQRGWYKKDRLQDE